MTKRHWRDSIKALGSHINPEQDEQVKKTKIGIHFFSKQPQSLQYYWRLWDRPIKNKYTRYKALLQVPPQCGPQHRLSWCVLPERVDPVLNLPERDLDDSVAKLMKLIQHKSQSKKGGGPVFDSELIDDFHKKYQTVCFLYEHLEGHLLENVYGKEDTDPSSSSSSSSVSFSSSSELKPYNSVQQFEELKSECARLSECLVERDRQLCSRMREIEDISLAAKELGDQNDGLRQLILDLEMTAKQREEKLSDLLIGLEENEANLMSKSEDLMEKANGLQLELDALWSEKEIVWQEDEMHMLSPQKSRSESSILKVNEEASGFTFQLELLKTKIDRKSMDLQTIVEEKKGLGRKVKDLEKQMESIMFENEGLHIGISELEETIEKRNYDVLLLEEEFEGLKKYSSTQIKALGEEISGLQGELNEKERYQNFMRGKKEVINKFIDEKKRIKTKYYDSKLKKFEESVGTTKVDNANTSDLAKRKNEVVHELEGNLDILYGDVGKKESEIIGLKKRIWKLENDLKGLGEEKREAIRQLCVWVDYHRIQNNYLKKILSGLHAFKS